MGFSIRDAFAASWAQLFDPATRKPTAVLWLFVAAIILMNTITLVLALSGEKLAAQGDLASLLAGVVLSILAYFFVAYFFAVGLTFNALTAAEGKRIAFSDFFKPHGVYWRFVGTALLTGIIIVLTFLLFIVPGIYFSLKFFFTLYAVVDRKAGPIQALRISSRLTRGEKWELVGFYAALFVAALIPLLVTVPFILLALLFMGNEVAVMIIALLGMIAFVFAMLVYLAFYIVAVAHAYRSLTAAHGEKMPAGAQVAA